MLWVTVWKEELTEQRNDFEDACLLRLKQLVPPDCAVTILANRGFGGDCPEFGEIGPTAI